VSGIKIAVRATTAERVADRAAAQVMSSPERRFESARYHIEAEDEAPCAVTDAIHSVGSPLDADTSGFFKQRFSHDFSAVRVHDNEKAADAARAIDARAFTVGNDIVFKRGAYQPATFEGRRLLAHELMHVTQQLRAQTLVVQRADDAPQSSEGGSLFDRAFALADESRWEDVAELVNGFSPEHLRYFIGTFRGQPDKISYMYLGAIGNKKVGSGSAIAKATKITYLDYNFEVESRKGNWSRAAYYINTFSPDDIRKRLAKATTDHLQALHAGAVDNAELGVDSAAAKVSAEVLAARAAAGEAKALLLPKLKGEGKEALAKVMRVIDGIRPSDTESGRFTITVDNQPEALTKEQAAEIRKKAADVLKNHLQQIRQKAQYAVDRYNGQSEVDRQHWIVAPIVKTIGRVKDPGPALLGYGASAQIDADAATAAVAAGNFTRAATLLASAETAAISAGKMWQAYFEGIISGGEMTITVLEITRDASFVTLAILATIASGGAAAGALGATEAGATGATAFGVELGTSAATAANVIAAGAPIVANVAEAAAKVSMGEKVDWGALVIDTAIQIIIARFGGRVTGGIAKRLLANPATENLAGKVTEKVVHAAILHVGSTALTTAAQDAYRALKGQGITWKAFLDDLIARLTDPKSLAIIAVTGALTSAAEAKFGPPKAPLVEGTPSPEPRVTEQAKPPQPKVQSRTETPVSKTPTEAVEQPTKVAASTDEPKVAKPAAKVRVSTEEPKVGEPATKVRVSAEEPKVEEPATKVRASKKTPAKAAPKGRAASRGSKRTSKPRSSGASTARIISERNTPDGVVIDMEIGPGVKRLGLEKTLPSGTEVGLKGWHRAHSVGPGFGAESGAGIRYAPPEVNLKYQNAGIEQFIREFNQEKAPDVKLLLRTETTAHPGTMRLKEITYRLSAQRAGGKGTILFERTIEVGSDPVKPKVWLRESDFPSTPADWPQFLAEKPTVHSEEAGQQPQPASGGESARVRVATEGPRIQIAPEIDEAAETEALAEAEEAEAKPTRAKRLSTQ
jgi:outer membrane biosynthesis protein TonB